MNVMIDTNIVLDDILDRFPNSENARKISRLVTDEQIVGYLTANCITDFFLQHGDEFISEKERE